jgi:hypothetical protein
MEHDCACRLIGLVFYKHKLSYLYELWKAVDYICKFSKTLTSFYIPSLKGSI